MKRTLTSVATAVALLVAGTHAVLGAEEKLSVLHWWTSGGESKALRVLKADMSKQGYEWKDFAIAGGAGAAAMTALKTQVIAGNAPSAAQVKGPLIQDWASQGVLVNIDSAATDWKKNLPPQIDKIMHADGHYVAAPISAHREQRHSINKSDIEHDR